MHSVSEMGVNNVPAFLTKLWTLVEDTATDDMISWDTVSRILVFILMMTFRFLFESF